jgi:hypothetical protein
MSTPLFAAPKRHGAALRRTPSKTVTRCGTARKSFLGHARLLNDLPVEAAMAWPTQRFAAHRLEVSSATVGGDWHTIDGLLVEFQPERFDHRRPECNVGGQGLTKFFGI